jgi:hypothetical protein
MLHSAVIKGGLSIEDTDFTDERAGPACWALLAVKGGLSTEDTDFTDERLAWRAGRCLP